MDAHITTLRRRYHLQRVILVGLGILIASFCSLMVIGHNSSGEKLTNVASNQGCVAMCHSHGAVPGDGTSLRQSEKDDYDPTPPPFPYWTAFNITLYPLVLIAPLAVMVYWRKTPVFLLQQKLRF